MRYLITFSYDGTKFHGFQRQKNVRNIQGELESILSFVLNDKIVIKGSGRTDAGVHATHQCAHFDTNKKIKIKDIKKINKVLNGDIIIKDYKKVKSDFHARHNVKSKTYLYKINTGNYDSSKEGYYYQISKDLDLKKMREVAKVLEGAHDYHNFVSGSREDYASIIYKISVKKKGSILYLKFTGIGFYRYMVRHLVGAMLDVAKGKSSIDEVKSMLDQPNVHKNLSVAPADGLYLIKVKY